MLIFHGSILEIIWNPTQLFKKAQQLCILCQNRSQLTAASIAVCRCPPKCALSLLLTHQPVSLITLRSRQAVLVIYSSVFLLL